MWCIDRFGKLRHFTFGPFGFSYPKRTVRGTVGIEIRGTLFIRQCKDGCTNGAGGGRHNGGRGRGGGGGKGGGGNGGQDDCALVLWFTCISAPLWYMTAHQLRRCTIALIRYCTGVLLNRRAKLHRCATVPTYLR